MPQPIDQQQTETVVLHAPWWNDATTRVDDPIWVFERRKRRNLPVVDASHAPAFQDFAEAEPDENDDDNEWVLRQTCDLPLARMVMKRHVTHKDAKWVQARAMPAMRFNGNRMKPDGQEMARMRTIGYLRRVLEMTDDAGNLLHITEEVFDSLPEYDTQYLDEAIKQLDDPVAPILKEDWDKARKRAAEVEDLHRRGFPVKADEEVDIPAYAAQEARNRTFRPAFSDLPGQPGQD